METRDKFSCCIQEYEQGNLQEYNSRYFFFCKITPKYGTPFPLQRHLACCALATRPAEAVRRSDLQRNPSPRARQIWKIATHAPCPRLSTSNSARKYERSGRSKKQKQFLKVLVLREKFHIYLSECGRCSQTTCAASLGELLGMFRTIAYTHIYRCTRSRGDAHHRPSSVCGYVPCRRVGGRYLVYMPSHTRRPHSTITRGA